jgi:hypothetical protein
MAVKRTKSTGYMYTAGDSIIKNTSTDNQLQENFGVL